MRNSLNAFLTAETDGLASRCESRREAEPFCPGASQSERVWTDLTQVQHRKSGRHVRRNEQKPSGEMSF